jgi:hypothetical protein
MKALFIPVLVLLLAGCATNVQRYSDAETPRLIQANEKIGKAFVTFSDSGQKDHADNAEFDQNVLLDNVKRQLDAKQLMATGDAGDVLEIKVTGMRVRSTFNAVMWGFMSGSDNVTGEVYLRDASGHLLNHFQVHAGYALGGFAGGIQSVRWDWLYGKFAELTVENLTSEPAKK